MSREGVSIVKVVVIQILKYFLYLTMTDMETDYIFQGLLPAVKGRSPKCANNETCYCVKLNTGCVITVCM